MQSQGSGDKIWKSEARISTGLGQPISKKQELIPDYLFAADTTAIFAGISGSIRFRGSQVLICD
jgi:hypothetical protein